MVHHRISGSEAPAAFPHDADVTEIIPFREFAALLDPTPCQGDPFAVDIAVLTAPELDDLNDLADEPFLLLSAPVPAPVSDTRRYQRSRPSDRAVWSSSPRAVPGAHRRTSDATGAVHSRVVIAAIAAGAVAAGVNAAADATDSRTDPVLVADSVPSPDSLLNASGMQIISVANGFDSATHSEELANGAAFAQERAQREARLRRPQFVFPVRGILTSAFGTRWGTLHGGLDIANAIGTPIYAASDGEVIASGPTPGYGMWVKIRAADGTVTLYGHIDTATVQTGDRVLAGDQIATVGNRGNSTGPHLHFEVHLNGSDKTDPMAWLRERGVADG